MTAKTHDQHRADSENIARVLRTLHNVQKPTIAAVNGAALAGGLIRQLGDVTLPAAVRRTKTYQTMVDIALRFMIEQVGQVEGVAEPEGHPRPLKEAKSVAVLSLSPDVVTRIVETPGRENAYTFKVEVSGADGPVSLELAW